MRRMARSLRMSGSCSLSYRDTHADVVNVDGDVAVDVAVDVNVNDRQALTSAGGGRVKRVPKQA